MPPGGDILPVTKLLFLKKNEQKLMLLKWNRRSDYEVSGYLSYLFIQQKLQQNCFVVVYLSILG